jgi:hypothetical protein
MFIDHTHDAIMMKSSVSCPSAHRFDLLLEITICLENVNRSEKFLNVFGGHLIFMKIRPRKMRILMSTI